MQTNDPAQEYPALEPRRSGMLPLDQRHTMYWEESGNPEGVPVLVLHGGPGSGTVPRQRRFFDPRFYRIVLFDQRGAGRSTPVGDCQDNTTAHLVADIETLRAMLGITQWLVFGGSWGSTLALCYAQTHPESCRALVLRGIFLCTQPEIDWFLYGMARFFPQAHARFAAEVEPDERADLLAAYGRRLFGPDPAVRLHAAHVWNQYEGSCLHLLPQHADASAAPDAAADAMALAVGRLEAHYFRHGGFLQPDQLLRGMDRLQHIDGVIVQGRYDVICPPETAQRLHQAWPRARLHIVEDAGHSAFEPGTLAALLLATQQFRDQGHFRLDARG